MRIEEAIESIADSETITGITAKMVMTDKKNLSAFVNMINDQYNRDGNNENMNELYGKEVIDSIINYGKENNLIKTEENND